jgi:hypothetical protein
MFCESVMASPGIHCARHRLKKFKIISVTVHLTVISAQAGIQLQRDLFGGKLDPRLRGDDCLR